MNSLLSPDALGLMAAVFVAAGVEFVEAFTIVLAMGVSRGWRAAFAGTLAALLTLAVLVLVLGLTLREYVNTAFLQLVVGALLLIFGMQWLRKAMQRSAGLKSLHDEEAIFERQLAAARAAGTVHQLGIDGFGFLVAYKGVLLEGLEVVFIVITFGLGAESRGIPDAMFTASIGAAAAAAVVLGSGAVVRKPLAMVPENTLKYIVGLLLTTFGTFWAVEGLGFFAPAGTSIAWPGADWALPGILLAWFAITRIGVALLRPLGRGIAGSASVTRVAP